MPHAIYAAKKNRPGGQLCWNCRVCRHSATFQRRAPPWLTQTYLALMLGHVPLQSIPGPSSAQGHCCPVLCRSNSWVRLKSHWVAPHCGPTSRNEIVLSSRLDNENLLRGCHASILLVTGTIHMFSSRDLQGLLVCDQLRTGWLLACGVEFNCPFQASYFSSALMHFWLWVCSVIHTQCTTVSSPHRSCSLSKHRSSYLSMVFKMPSACCCNYTQWHSHTRGKEEEKLARKLSFLLLQCCPLLQILKGEPLQ